MSFKFNVLSPIAAFSPMKKITKNMDFFEICSIWLALSRPS